MDCAAWWSSATARSARSWSSERTAQADHQDGGDAGRIQVFQADHHAALKQAVHDEDGVLGHADVNLVDLAAEDHGAEAVEQIGNAQRGHQQVMGS
jgi:hypothetical protein